MNDVLTLVKVVQLLLDMAGEVRAGIDETLYTEEKTLAGLEVYAHGPKCDFKLHNLPSRYLFLIVVRVEWDQFGATFRILCATRRA